jgi:hypothetical protein
MRPNCYITKPMNRSKPIADTVTTDATTAFVAISSTSVDDHTLRNVVTTSPHAKAYAFKI